MPRCGSGQQHAAAHDRNGEPEPLEARAIDAARSTAARTAPKADYEALKTLLLQAAADGRLTVPGMEQHMDDISRLHRAAERAVKAAQRLAPFRLNQALDNAHTSSR